MPNTIDGVNGNSAPQYTVPVPYAANHAVAGVTAATGLSVAAQAKVKEQHIATSVTDAAVLSVPAQAKLLQASGHTVSEIALELGLTATVVLSDLGISAATVQPQVTTTVLPAA